MRLLTVQEAADRLGISRSLAYQMNHKVKGIMFNGTVIPRITLNVRTHRYDPVAIDAAISGVS